MMDLHTPEASERAALSTEPRRRCCHWSGTKRTTLSRPSCTKHRSCPHANAGSVQHNGPRVESTWRQALIDCVCEFAW